MTRMLRGHKAVLASEEPPCLWPMQTTGARASRTRALSGGGTAAMRKGVTSRRLPSTTAAVPRSLVLLCRSMVTCRQTSHCLSCNALGKAAWGEVSGAQ